MRFAGFGKVSRRASAGEEGRRVSLLPRSVRAAGFVRFATSALNAVATIASIGFDHEQKHEHEYERGKSIWMAQHRIGEGFLAVAGLVVVPVSDFKAAFHFEPAAVGGVP